MDAAKGQYIHFMPDILRLLKTGGTLVSDNVLQDGDIIESHYAVIRRNRTIYKRMRSISGHTSPAIVKIAGSAMIRASGRSGFMFCSSVRYSRAPSRS